MAYCVLLNIINVCAESNEVRFCSYRTVSPSPLIVGFDPAYADAKGKAGLLGDFNFFSSWMSQPKTQLETFKVRKIKIYHFLSLSLSLSLTPIITLALGVGWKR